MPPARSRPSRTDGSPALSKAAATTRSRAPGVRRSAIRRGSQNTSTHRFERAGALTPAPKLDGLPSSRWREDLLTGTSVDRQPMRAHHARSAVERPCGQHPATGRELVRANAADTRRSRSVRVDRACAIHPSAVRMGGVHRISSTPGSVRDGDVDVVREGARLLAHSIMDAAVGEPWSMPCRRSTDMARELPRLERGG